MAVTQKTWAVNVLLARKLRERSGRNDIVVEKISWQGSTGKIVGLEISRENHGIPAGARKFIAVLIENPAREPGFSSETLLNEIANKIPPGELSE